MRFDKFTLKVQEGLQEAQTLAGNYGHQGIEVEHLLLALLAQPEGIVGNILKKLGAEPARIENEIKKAVERLPRVQGSVQSYITPRLNKILDKAMDNGPQALSKKEKKELLYDGQRMKKLHEHIWELPQDVLEKRWKVRLD